MSKRVSDLGPRERVEAALKLHQMEFPGTSLSVAKVCVQASVSRANLYEHHPDLVRKILGLGKAATKRAKPAATLVDLKKSLAAEKRRTKALLLVCVELQAEVRRLQARAVRNSEASFKKPGRKTKP